MSNTLSNTQKTGLAIAGTVVVLFTAAAIASPAEAAQSASNYETGTALVSSSGQPAEPGEGAQAEPYEPAERRERGEFGERSEVAQAEPAERDEVARA